MINRLIALALIFFHSFTLLHPLSLSAAMQPEPPSTDPLERPPIILTQGEQRLLRIPGLIKYSLGNSTIVRITSPSRYFSGSTHHFTPQSSQSPSDTLLIKGIAAGAGDLWVWKKDGESEYRAEHRLIQVHSLQPDKVGDKVGGETGGKIDKEFARSLGALEEVETLYTGKGVVLRGEIQSLKEASRIAQVLSMSNHFAEKVHDETYPSDALLEQCEHQARQWLEKSLYASTLRIEKIERSLWLRGSITRPTEKAPIAKRALLHCPLLQLEIDALPDSAPTVYFRVFLLELRKNQFHSIGLSWGNEAQGSFTIMTPSGPSLNISQIDMALKYLESTGEAKILSNPELVVRAPGEAELFAGGELPYLLKSRFFADLQWKKYGLMLGLKVTHVAGDRVRLEIQTEVSNFDLNPKISEVPSILANRMKTQVDARFGTPLYLSGLLQERLREEVRGLPLISQLPILGKLFGSEDYLNDRSELVAILYPHLQPPYVPPEKTERMQPKGPVPLPRNWLSPAQERTLIESKDYPWNALE